MTDVLLTTDKQSILENRIERELNNEFNNDCTVTVLTDGQINVHRDRESDTPLHVTDHSTKIYDIIYTLDLRLNNSPYTVHKKDTANPKGLQFQLERDDW